MTDISTNPPLEDEVHGSVADITNNPPLEEESSASSEDDIAINPPADS